MKLPCHFQLFVLVMIASTSTIAQAPQGLTDGNNQLTTITVSEGQNHLLEAKPPTYPPIAKAARIEGSVRLMLQVGATGAVVRVVPLSGHPLLIGAATDAAKQYRYQPFEVNGAPADVLVEAVISFSRSDRTPSASIPFPDVADINTVVMEYDDGRINIRILGSGLVDFNGTSGVVVEGKHQRRIGPQEVQQLLELFRKADFFSLHDDYSVAATDVGSTSTSIQIDNFRKSIVDNWVAVPPALKTLQAAILAVSDQWIHGNSDTVRSLLAEAGAGGSEILSEILPRAALYGDTATVRDILDTNVALERLGPYNATALLLAADRGLPDMVDALLKAGADPHAKDGIGRGALIFGASSGNPEVVRLLLARGLRGDEKDKYGDTALMAAAGAGNPECVRLLLNSGAWVNARNKRRQTALLSGATGDSGFSIIEMGRRRVQIPDEMIHREALVKMLVAAGAHINARGWNGETALFSLEDDVVKELINDHINLEVRDNSGQTALIETVSETVAELLIKAGANVNARDNDGNTALIMAAEYHEVAKLKVLINAPGIHLGLRNNKGETALMKARSAHYQDCADLLFAAGATE